jgi:hypothetical protein
MHSYPWAAFFASFLAGKKEEQPFTTEIAEHAEINKSFNAKEIHVFVSPFAKEGARGN